MLSKKLGFVLIILAISCTSKKKEQRTIYFVHDNDNSLETLNGNIKEIKEARADDKYSLNAGQDYIIVNLNKKGDVSRIMTGFHGFVVPTYYYELWQQRQKTGDKRVYQIG